MTTALMERRQQKPNPQKPRRQDTAALLRSLGMTCTLNRLLLIDEREVPALNGDEKNVPKTQFCVRRNYIWEGVNSLLCSRPLEEARQKSKYRDMEDNTALHMACMNCVPPKVFAKLLRISGDIVSAKCNEGRTVLRCACIGGCSFRVISALVKAYPEALSLQDENGLT
eukprot:15331604-Ditylum_brightwellii.AAC.1